MVGPAPVTQPVAPATPDPLPPAVITNTVTQYVPVFYSRNSIAVSPKNQLVRSGKTSELTFGQGLLSIAVTPFDNTFKFQVKTESTNTARGTVSFSTMDLTQFTGFELVFGSASSKISVPSVTDQSQVDSSIGEILFKVDATVSSKIQTLDDPKFYIVTVGKDGSRSALYTGKWYNSDNITTADSENANQLSAAQAEARLEERVTSLQTRINQLETENSKLKASKIGVSTAAATGELSDAATDTTNPVRSQSPVHSSRPTNQTIRADANGNNPNQLQ
jgi:hypothetical protein